MGGQDVMHLLVEPFGSVVQVLVGAGHVVQGAGGGLRGCGDDTGGTSSIEAGDQGRGVEPAVALAQGLGGGGQQGVDTVSDRGGG